MTQPRIHLELPAPKAAKKQQKEEEKRGVVVIEILEDDQTDPTILLDLSE